MSNTVPRLRDLTEIRPIYFLPDDPLVTEALVPCFRHATGVDGMFGFFSSASLATLAPGLAAYISGGSGKFRLVISPYLSDQDRAAIENAVRSPEEVATMTFESVLDTQVLLEQHTLACLGSLLASGRLEIRVALMKRALFHPKVWLFRDSQDELVIHGSSNSTGRGLLGNMEQIATSRSWINEQQSYVCLRMRSKFRELWDGSYADCHVVSLPKAVQAALLQSYESGPEPTEAAFRQLYEAALGASRKDHEYEFHGIFGNRFEIPKHLNYDSGDFAHQGRAVDAWIDAGRSGVLEMATGSGKTITAMIAAKRLHDAQNPILIVIAAPYLPLVQQWATEVQQFGLDPLDLGAISGSESRSAAVQNLLRRLRLGTSEAEAVILTHDALCSEEVQAVIEQAKCKKLLIADEVHNLGRPGFIENPPTFFSSRLGLSATPVRQYDEEGTEALLDYFGPIVFKYTLQEAIGNCLVGYEYYLHPVRLTADEMEEWQDLSERIRKNAWREDDGEPNSYLARLRIQRRAILESAENKVRVLGELLDKRDLRELQHTLIYASDKAPTQLNRVNELLSRKGVLFHQITADESRDRKKVDRLLDGFQRGQLQVLTAKRVLDEGVNIPQVKLAYILASTTVKRQWVQRRGRLLRKCSAIGKKYSEIHDLVALPPREFSADSDSRALVESELSRAREFASLALNAGRDDGPLKIIKTLSDSAFL